MNGSQRREQIVRQIQESKEPVSGKKLAELYGVSRQILKYFSKAICIHTTLYFWI